MMSEIGECVFSSPDRQWAADVAEELRQAGIAADFVPSERRIGTWDVEVSADDAVRARLIMGGSRPAHPLTPPRTGVLAVWPGSWC